MYNYDIPVTFKPRFNGHTNVLVNGRPEDHIDAHIDIQ